MVKRTVLSAVCAVAMLCGAAITFAQSSATLTLRSGERVSGDLVDLGGVGYTIRVNGNERQIAQNDVAVIDFTGGTMSASDWAKFTGTSQVVLRSGQTVDGSLTDIGGASPLRLTVRTANGERDFSSNDVARIIIARPDNVATSTSGASNIADTPSVAGAVTVQAGQQWTSTGRTVRKGQRVSFTTTGEIQLSDNAADIATADGAKDGRLAANAPLRNVAAGALIGRVGNGQPFPIGANTQPITMPANGVLYLGVNDDGFADNRVNFQVVIR
jgi:uncharacterized protein YdbL (DUF1318 family)